jgi:hypothetical protein
MVVWITEYILPVPGDFDLFMGEGSSPRELDHYGKLDSSPERGDGNWTLPMRLPAGQYTIKAKARNLNPDALTV